MYLKSIGLHTKVAMYKQLKYVHNLTIKYSKSEEDSIIIKYLMCL